MILRITSAILWLMNAAWGFGAPAAADPEATREGLQFFERRIRPVLIERCYPCHSARAEQPGAGLRLDSREGLRQGGEEGPVVVPGDPGRSLLLEVLRRPHPENRMPPRSILPRSAILDFETWIRIGCPDPREEKPKTASSSPSPLAEPGMERKHWAFEPVGHPAVPSVRDAAWGREPIDRFILAGLESKGVRPAPEAGREALLRRASFDLTGLPPSVPEIEAFVADRSPDAFAKVVDRLLASPCFGERWGGYWLDLIRYADLGARSGEWSAVRANAWRYRDYVIGAFNADKPYDEFIREQLAGDLLPERTDAVNRQRLVATGFLEVGARLGAEPRRGRLLLDVADEQVELTTRVFLGLTVACARCHDHKSDPVPMREYYAMAGIFLSTSSLEESAEAGRRATPHWLERSLATADELRAVSEYETRFEELKEQLQDARQMKIAFPGEIDSARLEGVVVDNLAAEIHGAWKESNYSTNFVDRNYLHDANAEKGKKSARFVPDLSADGVYDVMVSYTPRANRATNVPVTITSKDGTRTVYLNQTLTPTIDKVFASVGKFKFAAGTNGSVVISNQGTKGFVVVDAVRFVPVPAGGLVKAAPPEAADPEKALLNFHELERQVLEFRAHKPVLPQAMAVQEGKIRDGRLVVRGDPDRPGAGEEVPRGFLSALGTPDSTLYAITDESSGRLELAYWLANPDNPLTARVAVNRVWLHLFGQGLVRTPDDFGLQGERPTHPELLDYLARQFMDQGWSVKKLIRSIMLSRAYQMRSFSTPPISQDSENRLLACRTDRVLPPPVLRDSILCLSGELQPNGGGPWMPTNSTALAPLQAALRVQLDSARRSVYLPVIRDAPSDVLRFLDGAVAGGEGVTASPSRRVTGRFLDEQCQAWADVLLRATSDDEQRLRLAFRQSWSRVPTTDELALARGWLHPPTNGDQGAPGSAWDLWANVCQHLLTSRQFRVLE